MRQKRAVVMHIQANRPSDGKENIITRLEKFTILSVSFRPSVSLAFHSCRKREREREWWKEWECVCVFEGARKKASESNGAISVAKLYYIWQFGSMWCVNSCWVCACANTSASLPQYHTLPCSRHSPFHFDFVLRFFISLIRFHRFADSVYFIRFGWHECAKHIVCGDTSVYVCD